MRVRRKSIHKVYVCCVRVFVGVLLAQQRRNGCGTRTQSNVMYTCALDPRVNAPRRRSSSRAVIGWGAGEDGGGGCGSSTRRGEHAVAHILSQIDVATQRGHVTGLRPFVSISHSCDGGYRLTLQQNRQTRHLGLARTGSCVRLGGA